MNKIDWFDKIILLFKVSSDMMDENELTTDTLFDLYLAKIWIHEYSVIIWLLSCL